MMYTDNKKDLILRRKKRQRLKQRIRMYFWGLALLVAGFMLGKSFDVEAAGTVKVPADSGYIIDNRAAVTDTITPAEKEDPYGEASDGGNIENDKNKQPKQNTNDDQWQLVLINSTHPLAKPYKPPLKDVGNGYTFDARAADSLNQMLAAAKAEGLSPIICSAYRTIEKQTDLYNKQVRKQMAQGLSYAEAGEEAKKVVAYPGTSEHHTGLAVDIVAKGYQVLDDKQAETPEAKWLKGNCYKYGFILRYPADKSDITGIIFEPWHFRYVGVTAATKIMENNICLEEYLHQL